MRVLVTGGSGFIGTHLLARLSECGYDTANVDIAAPPSNGVKAKWINCSILDESRIMSVVKKFRPRYVVHLAAFASMEARSLDEFQVNTVGTATLLRVVAMSNCVERLIITSTQHVRAPGSGYPTSDTDYAPYLFYGQSKVITEEVTRKEKLDCVWSIIRPTAVWGPGHKPLANGLWRLMRQGIYVHPARDPVVRSYGYVKNVVWQIERLLQSTRADVDRKVLYVADGNSRQLDWVNALSRELTGHDVRTVPLWLLRGLSLLGDGLQAGGLKFPLYNSRLMNLITPNPVPVEPTLELLGTPPYSLKTAAEETASWLRAYYRGNA